MLMRPVDLPGPLVVVPAHSLDGVLSRLRRDHPGLPDSVEGLTADFSERGEIPAVLAAREGHGEEPGLLLYGRGFLALLVPDGSAGTGTAARCYRMRTVRPLRFKDHHRLAQGCLLLRPAGWSARYTTAALPDGADTHWDVLTAQWELLRKEVAHGKRDSRPGERASGHGKRTSAPGEREQGLLRELDRVVDKEFAIQREQARAMPPFPYRAVVPAADRRLTSRSVHTFALHGRRTPAAEEVLQVRGQRDLRGQVVSVDDATARVTLAFDRAVDWRHLPKQGELERVANRTAHTRRTDALAALRDGTARNPLLLPVLAGTRPPRAGQARATPVERLDEGQRAAFTTAVATQDLSVVVGPPGTGKTRVVTEVVRAVAREGGHSGRVLVTAHSNAAVDNVLSRLPEDLLVIRVGHEGRVSDAARPYLLQTRVTALRQGILDRVEARLRTHDGGRAADWVKALDDALDRLACAVEKREAARAALRSAVRSVAGPAQRRVDRLAARLRRARRRQARLSRRHAFLRRHRDRCPASRRHPVAGLPRRVLLRCRELLLTRTAAAASAQDGVTARADLAWREAEAALDAATRENPAVRREYAALRKAGRECHELREAAFEAAGHCRRLLAPVAEGPSLPEPTYEGPEPPDDRPLAAFAGWARQAAPLLTARRELLSQWRDDVSAATDQLHAELIRYAHVVGATTTGSAGPALLTGVEFDLAVVDEAGQITTADALVPLVRARRGVLVGDHRQLPPFRDEEVLRWARAHAGREAAELIGTSVLELAQERLPQHAVARLWEQRRMPREVADFCSQAFYDGRLITSAGRRTLPSGLFRSPFVLVDTSALPLGDRAESKPPRPAADGARGFVNTTEAELLADLAQHYAERDEEWAVIVPYRAQAALVRSLLAFPAAGGGDVATVDSFQGGERDVVLYGFTRSNPKGAVGFLDELRRANVAFTRARRQLVLVGDLATLTQAQDPAFRDLARALRAHVDEQGQIVPYDELSARLQQGRVRGAGR